MDGTERHWYDRFCDDAPAGDAWAAEPPCPAPALERRCAAVPAPPVRGRPGPWVVFVAVAVLGMTAAFGVPAALRYYEHFHGAQALHFHAAPYFSLYAFRTLEPGMSEEAVRDTIGFPLSRYRSTEHGVRWAYTAPQPGYRGPHLLCLAVFDPITHRLAASKEVTVDPPQPPPPEWLLRLCEVERSVAFTAADGSQHTIDDTSRRRCVVLTGSVASGPEGVDEAQSRVAAMEHHLQELAIDHCEVAFVYAGLDREGFSDAVLHAKGPHDRIYIDSEPRLGTPECSLLHICADRSIVTVPPDWCSADTPSYEADRDWALRRCLK